MSNRQKLFDQLQQSMMNIGKVMKMQDIGDIPCSPAQYHVLMVAGMHASMNVKHLAELLSVTSGAATQHVDALEKQGLLARTVNANDRREIVVKLTEKGEDTVQKMRLRHHHMMKELFENLTDEELGTMVMLMEKVSSKYAENKETVR